MGWVLPQSEKDGMYFYPFDKNTVGSPIIQMEKKESKMLDLNVNHFEISRVFFFISPLFEVPYLPLKLSDSNKLSGF